MRTGAAHDEAATRGAPGSLLEICTTASYRRDPYPFLAALRRRAAVDRVPGGPWLVTRYDEVSAILRDPRLGNDPRRGDPASAAAVGGTGAASSLGVMPPPISALDPPEHGRVRAAVGSALPLRLAAALRERVAEVTDEVLDRLAARTGDTVDLVAQLAAVVPTRIAVEQFDLPARERDDLVRWGSRLAANGDPDPLLSADERAGAADAEQRLARAFARLALGRRRRPGPDLVSALAAAGPAALSFPELVVNGAFLFVNSYHNTVSLIANGLLALLRHPAELARLGADPALAPAAVEEALRYDSPVQSIARVTREAVPLGGVTIPAGQPVMALIGAAHRDPDAFDTPDGFRLSGRDRRALSFGAGPHYCPGAGIARMEAEIVLGRVASRLPGLTLAGPPEWTGTLALRGVAALPVRL